MHAEANPEYTRALSGFLAEEYGLRTKKILPAKRGFYGETWRVRAENGDYFLKIDYWKHHEREFRESLPVIRYMTDRGISFVPKIISTKAGGLYSRFRQGTAAVFEHVPGELSENYSVGQLYRRLAEVYRLKTEGLALKTEDFGTRRLDAFRRLKDLPALPEGVKKALAEKRAVISGYMRRLQRFSALCKGKGDGFHITHGDAGGNCILDGERLFIVDWDTVMAAPVERDAWIFICDDHEMEKIISALSEKGIRFAPDRNRLCFYCYDFFFHYLNEYLISVAEAENRVQKEKIAGELIGYLSDCWIYERLKKADAVDAVYCPELPPSPP